MTTWFDDNAEWREPEDLGWERNADFIHPYQRIMTVVNDTPSMPVTVRHAIRLAVASNAEVNFLAIPIIPATAAMPDTLAVTDNLLCGLTKRSQALLDWAAETAADAGVPCRTYVQWGPLPGTILHLADTTQCDLIIMGTPARSGWWRFLQPCVTKRVAAQARQPVLVIKESCLPRSVLSSRRHQGLRSEWAS